MSLFRYCKQTFNKDFAIIIRSYDLKTEGFKAYMITEMEYITVKETGIEVATQIG